MKDAPKTMALRAAPAKGVVGEVDRENGIIHGLAIVTMGEARGHGVHLDEEFVDETVKNVNKQKSGIKSRFGHPNMSSSAVGTYLGQVKNAWKDTSGKFPVARGDLHLSESSKKAPQGDLWEYVMSMAEEDPEAFGTSIVFDRGNVYKRDDKGGKVYRYNRDGSYNREYQKVESKEYVEQKRLRGDDVVDEPAANPAGLFSADQPAAVVTQFLDENPEIWTMLQEDDVEEIFSAFKERYEFHRNQASEHETPATNTQEPKQMEEQEKKTATHEQTVAQLSSLKGAFPKDLEFAVDSFEKGLTVEQAKAAYCDKLQTENDQLSAKVAELEAEIAESDKDEEEAETKPEGFEAEGTNPVGHVEAKLNKGKAKTKKEEAEAKLEEYKEGGLSFNESVVKLSKSHPELIDELNK